MKHCKYLNGDTVAITPGFLRVCGSATHSKGSPIACDYNTPDIDYEAFTSGLSRIIEANQTDNGPCTGCTHLLQCKPHKASRLMRISLHDFSGCNAHCTYCAGSEFQLPVNFRASQDHIILFENLWMQELIHPRAIVSWGGGEPTLLNTFNQTVAMLRSWSIQQVINTNGIVFSPDVALTLRDNLATVRISVDSGTDEMYQAIKQNSHCTDVWNSIRRYAAVSNNFILKYIILDINSNHDEITAFLRRAEKAGVRRICISVDAHLVYSHLGKHLTNKELLAAASLYNEAKTRGISAYFESIWPLASLKRIEQLGQFKIGTDWSHYIREAKRRLGL